MAEEIRVPVLGESVVEATVTRWLKREGEPVAAGDVLVELETDKVNVELPAEHAGVLEKIVRGDGETVAVNEVIALLGAGSGSAAAAAPAAASAPPAPQSAPEPPVPAADNGRQKTPASPVAEKIAAVNKVDLASVAGTGPGGKIVKGDVEAAMRTPAPASPAPPQAAAPAPAPVPLAATPNPLADLLQQFQPSDREERIKMSRRRKTIAQRLVDAQHNAAMLTTFNEVDMTAVMEIRKRRRDSFKERHGVGLGFMSFFTRAAIGALKAFPLINAEIQDDEIVIKKYYDIGIAVSTDEGLVVPVLRDADRRSFADIEKGIVELATRARSGKLTIPELVGGTFTITNGGIFGSLLSTPILNAPQVGILGMHKIQERPVALNGQVVIRPMMYLALSYDHRIVDGKDAVQFLVKIKELLEDPETFLLEG